MAVSAMTAPVMCRSRTICLLTAWGLTAVLIQPLLVRSVSAQPAATSDVAVRIASPDASVRLAAAGEALAAYLAEDLDDPGRRALVFEPAGLSRAQRAFAGAPFTVWAVAPPPELTSALLKAIADDDRQIRIEAAYTFGAIARPPVSPTETTSLLTALGHVDPLTRAAAARVIGRLGVQAAGDALVAAMNDPDEDVRAGAIWGLGELRFERGVQALTDFVQYYRRRTLGLWAMEALARIGHLSSLHLFQEALLDRDPAIRRLAAEGLGRVGHPRSVDHLEGLVGSERDPHVRAAALFALEKLDRHAGAALVSLLADRRTFAAARRYLLELREPALLLPRLTDPEARVRQGAADVLGLIGTADAIPPLAGLRQDPDAGVRDAAARALRQLRLRGFASAS